MNYTVAQLGARMHYAVPRLLQERGKLERFYTDLYAEAGWPQALRLLPQRVRPAGVRRLLARKPEGLPRSRITSFPVFGLHYAVRRSRAGRNGAAGVAHLWAGKEFCRRVIAGGLGESGGVYCFNSAGLELLEHAKATGRKAVLEQTIAPLAVERRLLEEEEKRFPGWATTSPVRPDSYAELEQRERAEWQAADLVLCGSEFVRESIRDCGGPLKKAVVVSYGFACPTDTPKPKPETGSRPLRVLTVGAVSLRKGAPYVLAAAKATAGRMEFRMVGPINISSPAAGELGRAVDLTGPAIRSEIGRHYEWADVFLLPSLCEGSATATYEALAHGLPVVCTPNTGSIVRHGKDGFIVPIRSPEQIAQRLEQLAAEKGLLREMGENAVNAAAEAFNSYGDRLLAVLDPGV